MSLTRAMKTASAHEMGLRNYDTLRATMVDALLRPQGVSDARVLQAMGQVARERGVPESARHLAYADQSVPLAVDRVMLPPVVLARLVQALEIQPNERVLVVGAGVGEGVAVLKALGASVVASEDVPELRNVVAEIGAEEVWPEAPEAAVARAQEFDKILLSVALAEVPVALVRALRPQGVAAGLVPGAGGVLQLRKVVRHGQALVQEVMGDTPSMPLHPSCAQRPVFVF